MPMGERPGLGISIPSTVVVQSSFPAKSWRITLLQGAAELPDFILLHLAQHFCWYAACSSSLQAHKNQHQASLRYFYHLVDNQLIVSREGPWLSLCGEALSTRYENAITQPLTPLLPEQMQPSPRGLTSQVQVLTCTMFHFTCCHANSGSKFNAPCKLSTHCFLLVSSPPKGMTWGNLSMLCTWAIPIPQCSAKGGNSRGMLFEILRWKHASTVPCHSGKCNLESSALHNPPAIKVPALPAKIELWSGGEGRTGIISKQTKVDGWWKQLLCFSLTTGIMQRTFSVRRHWLGPRALSLGVASVTEMFFGDLVLEHTQPRAV